MHAELEAVLNNLNPVFPFPTAVSLKNAERILNYMEDINLEKTGRFELTPAESLYILWDVEDLEFHIECLKNGMILYTFRKGGRKKSSGSYTCDEFIPQLEKCLLTGMD